jgi:UDP-glucose 4-epimerase
MKKVLVTGGAGYIGAHTVVELVQAGYDAIIVDNLSRSDNTLLNGIHQIIGRRPVFYQGDCLDKSFLDQVFRENRISAVLHFAAYKSVGESVQFPLMYYQNNLQSLIVLLEAMHKHGVTDMIFSSSCTVYGQPDHTPVGESAPFKRAESPYGATKQMCERILEDALVSNFKIISLRYFNPIGAHPSALLGELPIGVPNNLVPYITQTAIGMRERLTVFGADYNTPDGSCVRDFIHVVDLADAHVKAMEYLATQHVRPFYDVFNLGTGIGVSVLELIQKFEHATGEKLNYTIGARRPGDVEITFADPTKVNTLMGWRAKHTVEEALLHAWNWEKKISQK